MLIAFLVSACGGSGGGDSGGVSQHSAVSVSELNELLEQQGIDVPGLEPGGPYPIPETRTLQWPADFPATIRAGLTDTVFVEGLPLQAAYWFDVALPEAVDSEDVTLFVLNSDIENQSGGAVCYGDPDCIGTVTSGRISLQLVSFASGAATLSITPSATPALINEGSEANPVLLTVSSTQLLHTGTVGGVRTSQGGLQSGRSFYRLNDLQIGQRYSIMLSDPSDNDPELLFDTDSMRCDPSYSGSLRCVLIAGASELEFSVDGGHSLFGASFTIAVSLVSVADAFEGSWHDPLTLMLADSDDQYHLGRSDRYSSYYRLTGLDANRRYQLLMSGSTAPARLKLNSPQTSEAVYAPQCRAIDDVGGSGDQHCLIENVSETYFRVESVEADAQFLLSIITGPGDEGSPVTPLALQLNDSRLSHHGSVNRDSFYRIAGLTPGLMYLLQINAGTSFPAFALSTGSGEEIDCLQRGVTDCIFTALDDLLEVTVSDADSDIGEQFLISVLPIDPGDTVRPAPYQQDMDLDSLALPLAGTVSDWFSQYTVTGLNPDQYYLASIRDRSETMSFAAWPNTASGILCNISLHGGTENGCLTQAGSDGELRIRVGGDSGGQFSIDVTPAAVMQSDYQSRDTPIVIADNSPTAAVSSINVPDTQTVEFIEVVVLIQHGYTQDLNLRLQSPDGRMITLADHVAGTTFGHTVFSDLAGNRAPSEFTSHVLQHYRPGEPLHPLRGINAAGIWRLHVGDDSDSNRSDAQGGALLEWGLRFIGQP